jgi:hypothetical protein
MTGWRDCAVSLIDFPGIRKLARQPDTKASDLMRTMHTCVANSLQAGLPNHKRAYIWNDSVLLLAFLDQISSSPEKVLREVDGLKRKVDALANDYGLPDSYAISVKGQAFPPVEVGEQPKGQGSTAPQPRAVIIEASSYALANCYLIEESLGKDLKKPWYVDSRLASEIKTDLIPARIKPPKLLPGTEVREVYVYSGYLWLGE